MANNRKVKPSALEIIGRMGKDVWDNAPVQTIAGITYDIARGYFEEQKSGFQGKCSPYLNEVITQMGDCDEEGEEVVAPRAREFGTVIGLLQDCAMLGFLGKDIYNHIVGQESSVTTNVCAGIAGLKIGAAIGRGLGIWYLSAVDRVIKEKYSRDVPQQS